MRVLLGITTVTVLVTAVWFGNPTVAKQTNTVSIDPISMMATATNMPTEQYDAF